MSKIYINKKGYPAYSNTRRLVHRVVAQNKVGRELRPHEVVHHRDGDKTNFRRSNLRVTSRSYHSKLHKKYKY